MNQTSMKLDINLTTKDIQGLSSADAIAAFFSKLGYNTNARTPQTPGNLGITSDAALKPIKRIELIADQENFLQVYLFEVKSVTFFHIRALVNYFKNKAPHFLFVLTSDYERLDFVLLERILPEQPSQKSIGIEQVRIRPRPLTIDRKHGSSDEFRIALRVLRRFTYTESDPIAQYDKLKNAYTIADWSEEFFNNQALFSDYYLKVRLPEEYKEWKEDPKPAFQELNQLLFSKIQELRGQKEQVLREEILEPVFKVLGFDWKVGKKAGSEDPEPDYMLHAPSGKETLAFCLAYPWARHLDGKDPKDPESPNEDPSRLVVSLLESGDAPWAIVTNGKVWRLYAAKTHSKASNYYEIDLEEVLVHSGQTDAYADFFKYFWLFFRRQAFESAPIGVEGKTREAAFLDRLLTESEQYAKELGERLKEQVFEQIFPHLAEGFIVNIREREGKEAEFSPERLDQIFQGTLTLLYRLLFLLYAEARDLLPVREIRGYYEVSLTRIKTGISDAAGTLLDQGPKKLKKVYTKNQYTLYEHLTRLFNVIDDGDSTINVPVYNGGLFLNAVDPADQSSEAKNARFLNNNQVPDLYLALALNLLTRDIDPKSQALVSIDFKSLGVRQLGSIYEGLLEFKVRVAPEKMAVVKGKKTEEIIPYKQAQKDKRKILTIGRSRNGQERTFPKGAVYLENNKHERKATGSYYTPDHIVKYIIENAVGPMLEEKFEQTMRPKLREAQQAYKEAIKHKEAFEKQKMKGDDPEKVAHTYRHVVDELFNVKVLDPAMGSGHFLVEAVDFITDKAIHFLNAFPWNPVTTYLEETRRTILNEMEQQGVSIDPSRLTDINLLKRYVLKRCIYGVDLNPMAVELAKVSLWLNCFTLGAPLSFLDHHMKCGNSLIGASVEEVQQKIEEDRQFQLWGSQFSGLMLATQLMRHVGELSDVTNAQVQESRKEYKEALGKLQPFRRILDVFTSQWFSNPIRSVGKGKNKKEVSDALDFLKSQDCQDWIENKLETNKLDKESKAIVQTAITDDEEKCFFHWELEFPEVFYGPKPGTAQTFELLENGGFNAVIGNPPWGAEIPTQDKNLIRYQFRGSNKGSIDTFAVFTELSARLSVKKGFLGLLLPDILLLKNYPNIRLFLLEETTLIELIHWGQAFDQANIDVCSIVAIHCVATEDHLIRCIPKVAEEEISTSPLNLIEQTIFLRNKQYRFNILLSTQLQELLEIAKSLGPPLAKLCRLREGVHSGNVREKLFLDQPIGDTCEHLIFGRGEISIMQITWAGKYIQLDSSVFNREAGEYYNLGDPKLHKSKKLIVRRTGDFILAAIDDRGYFCSNNFFLCVPFPEISWKIAIYICAVLNSHFATWFFRSIQPRTGRLFAELKITHLEEIPIPFWDQPWAEQVGVNFQKFLQAKTSKDAVTKFIQQFNSDLRTKMREINPKLSDEIWRGK